MTAAAFIAFISAHDASKQRQKADQERQERHRQQQARERQLRRHSMDGYHRPSASTHCNVNGPHNSNSSTHGVQNSTSSTIGSAARRSTSRDRILRPLQRYSTGTSSHAPHHSRSSSSGARDAGGADTTHIHSHRHSQSHSPAHEHRHHHHHHHSSNPQLAAAEAKGPPVELLGAAVPTVSQSTGPAVTVTLDAAPTPVDAA